jgi:hypothetical protein
VRAEDPAEGRVLAALGERGFGALVARDVAAIPERARHVAVGDLQRALGLGGGGGGELQLAGRLAQPRLGLAGERRVIQQCCQIFLTGEHERVDPALQGATQRVEAALAEHQVAVGEPDPIGSRRQRGVVASDGAAEQVLLRQGPPLPAHVGEANSGRQLQQSRRAAILAAEVHRHGRVHLARRMQDQRTQLVLEQVRVVPAVADDLKV